MAVTFPLNLLDDMDGIGWSTQFELAYRQEQSRHASGRIRVKDFGTPLWTATYQTKNLSPNKIDYWRARLSLLENGLNTFWGRPRSRCWPIKYPTGQIPFPSDWVVADGEWDDDGFWYNGMLWNGSVLGGKIATIGEDNKSFTVTWMGEPIELSVGDYVQIGNFLHIINYIDDETYSVAPFLSNSIEVDDEVIVAQPGVPMTIVPGSISTSVGLNGRGSISFSGIEARG